MFIKDKIINMTLGKKFILASNSRSRYRLLKNAGLNFVKLKPICNEENIKKKFLKKNPNKQKLAKYLAKEKALSVSKKKTKHLCCWLRHYYNI